MAVQKLSQDGCSTKTIPRWQYKNYPKMAVQKLSQDGCSTKTIPRWQYKNYPKMAAVQKLSPKWLQYKNGNFDGEKEDINHPGWENFEWNGLKYSYSGFKLSTVYNAILRKWSKLKQQEENIQKLESLKFIKLLGIEREEVEGGYHLQL